MSTFSLPVERPMGHALLVGTSGAADSLRELLARIGLTFTLAADPYAAMARFVCSPGEFQTLIVSLAGVYREELELIAAVKRRFPQVEVWVTQTDGRSAALAQAMQAGADGILSEEGFHRVALTPAAPAGPIAPSSTTAAPAVTGVSAPTAPSKAERDDEDDYAHFDEPLLSVDELRALLQEPATSGSDD